MTTPRSRAVSTVRTVDDITGISPMSIFCSRCLELLRQCRFQLNYVKLDAIIQAYKHCSSFAPMKQWFSFKIFYPSCRN